MKFPVLSLSTLSASGTLCLSAIRTQPVRIAALGLALGFLSVASVRAQIAAHAVRTSIAGIDLIAYPT